MPGQRVEWVIFTKKISTLAKEYADNLKVVTNSRLKEMISHYLIYRVLGVHMEEGRLIDEYQNKGRFLYKYAGSFLEEATMFCFEEKFSNAQRKVRIPNIVNQFNVVPTSATRFFIEFCRILREFRLLVHTLQANTAKLSKKAHST
jgi:hypothetical protein